MKHLHNICTHRDRELTKSNKYSNQASEEIKSLQKCFVEGHAVEFGRRVENYTNLSRLVWVDDSVMREPPGFSNWFVGFFASCHLFGVTESDVLVHYRCVPFSDRWFPSEP